MYYRSHLTQILSRFWEIHDFLKIAILPNQTFSYKTQLLRAYWMIPSESGDQNLPNEVLDFYHSWRVANYKEKHADWISFYLFSHFYPSHHPNYKMNSISETSIGTHKLILPKYVTLAFEAFLLWEKKLILCLQTLQKWINQKTLVYSRYSLEKPYPWLNPLQKIILS